MASFWDGGPLWQNVAVCQCCDRFDRYVLLDKVRAIVQNKVVRRWNIKHLYLETNYVIIRQLLSRRLRLPSTAPLQGRIQRRGRGTRPPLFWSRGRKFIAPHVLTQNEKITSRYEKNNVIFSQNMVMSVDVPSIFLTFTGLAGFTI
jgi:hypothetical protein